MGQFDIHLRPTIDQIDKPTVNRINLFAKVLKRFFWLGHGQLEVRRKRGCKIQTPILTKARPGDTSIRESTGRECPLIRASRVK